MVNFRKILEIKSFQITRQIHKGYASLFVKPFSSRILQICTRFNCPFWVKHNRQSFGRIGGVNWASLSGAVSGKPRALRER